MTRRAKTAAALIIAVALVLGGGAVVIARSSEPPLLTDRAARVASLPTPEGYCDWLSDHEFVFYNSNPPLPLTVVDTRTGTSRALEQFEKRIGEEMDFADFSLSPDGARALWGSMDGFHRAASAALDGSSVPWRGPKREEVCQDASNALWMPNSRQWLQLLKGDQGFDAVIEGLDAPGIVRRTHLDYPEAITGITFRIRLLGRTPTGRILATPDDWGDNQNPTSQRTIDFFDFSLDGGIAVFRPYVISLPKAGEKLFDSDGGLSVDEEVRLAPRGDRLAWIVHTREEPSILQNRLARWIPSLRKAAHLHTELRVSRLDGSEMRIVGYVETDLSTFLSDMSKMNEPHDLRWLPNGQEVSFLYKGALWKVPAH